MQILNTSNSLAINMFLSLTCFQLLWNIFSPSIPSSVSKINPLLVPINIDPVDVSDWFVWLKATAVISWSRNFSIFFGLSLLRCKYNNSGKKPECFGDRAIRRWFPFGSRKRFDTRSPVRCFSRKTSVNRFQVIIAEDDSLFWFN